MGLKSRQEQEAEKLYGQMQRTNVNIKNPFESYNLTFKPLTAGELDVRTQEYFGEQENALRQALAQKRAEDLRAVAQRLINQNIAGGLRNALQSRVSSQYAGQEAQALGQLKTALAGQKLQNLLTAQEQARLYDALMMSLLGQRANVDLANVTNTLNKFSQLGGMVKMFDDTTWLDDVLAVLNTAGNIYGSIYGTNLFKKQNKNSANNPAKNPVSDIDEGN